MKKLMMVVAAALVAVSGIAGEVNLRDWLTSKGVTVSDCVSGIGASGPMPDIYTFLAEQYNYFLPPFCYHIHA